MCDTVVAVDKSGVWLAKNSDREPGEAQLVEQMPRSKRGGSVQCTHIAVPDVAETFAVTMSRPFWMWGAEMGVNEHGVAIGNEAVFTKEKLDPIGLTGMDLLRLALERASSAREAVDVIALLLRAHGQGGRMGYRNEKFTYASSFLIADAKEAWVMETAGRRWAAEHVTAGVRSISNALTIKQAALVDEDHQLHQTAHDFAGAYSNTTMASLAGAQTRSACTARAAGPRFAAMASALRDHAGHRPGDGVLMNMPCGHASFLPTRTAGQTTGSMIAHLAPSSSPRVWFTGTSSPCISVFKPVPVGVDAIALGPAPAGRFDNRTLWWRHEQLHRQLLVDWTRAAEVRAKADELEARCVDDVERAAASWSEHTALVAHWHSRLPEAQTVTSSPGFLWFWRRQNARDDVPA